MKVQIHCVVVISIFYLRFFLCITHQCLTFFVVFFSGDNVKWVGPNANVFIHDVFMF